MSWRVESVTSQQKRNEVNKEHTYEELEDVFLMNERVSGPSGRRSSVSVKDGLRVPLLIEEGKGKGDVEAKSKRKGARKSKETEEMSVDRPVLEETQSESGAGIDIQVIRQSAVLLGFLGSQKIEEKPGGNTAET
ncbi:hypothetical protein K435DRAFT_805778 [Dendrothele bispora CBS 962.96]|uniref:Uncharacterized protein n=1 Tax=Dendrothele bispora (strain CBS 962.96) TaxID=1314807 RepID=A0A4S8LAE4_DENBC|nr:hypothetical protein K435DRAFT_805778 [Dendrothele bispora CBS 962.96]